MSLSKLLSCQTNIRENNNTASRAIASILLGPRAGEAIEVRLHRISIHTIACLMYTQRTTNASISIIYHAKQRYKTIISAIKKFKVEKEASKLIEL